MKIFGVIHNLHQLNLKAEIASNNSYFFIPDTSLLKTGRPFFLPDKEEDFCLAPSFVVKIDKVGKTIAERFAGRYYSEFAVGALIYNRNLLCELSLAGAPLTPALTYDYNAPISAFFPFDHKCDNIRFDIFSDGNKIYSANGSALSRIDKTISELSRFNTLKTGDLIFSSLDLINFKLNLNSKLLFTLNEEVVFKSNIK